MDDKASDDLWQLLVKTTFSPRKKRLFLANCLNHIIHQITGKKDLNAVKILNLYADGKITKNEAKQAAKRWSLDPIIKEVYEITHDKIHYRRIFMICNAMATRVSRTNSVWTNAIQDKYDQEMRWQWDLLRHMTNSKMRPNYG